MVVLRSLAFAKVTSVGDARTAVMSGVLVLLPMIGLLWPMKSTVQTDAF